MARRSKKRKADRGAESAPVAIKVTAPRKTRDIPEWPWGLLLLLMVFAAYLPVWWSGYIWDDAFVLTDNPVIVGPQGLKEIWTTGAADICPLTLTTFWFEHALWGLAPLPYHLVNIAMHGVNAILLWRILRGLLVPGAWLGAAVWAVHPVQVESVAWITEMKNTESGLFFLLSVLFFLRWLKAKNWNWNYLLTMTFAALAMASKSSTVILPVVLCLCTWWMERKWDWRSQVKIGPLFLLSIIAGLISIWTQGLNGASDPQWRLSWPQRLVSAGNAIWFYLGKLIWPHPLLAVYPRWKFDSAQWFAYLPLVGAILLIFTLYLSRDRLRPGFFALAYFLVALFPVLGLFDFYFQRYSFVADHFQYLASMGPMALTGAVIVHTENFIGPSQRWLLSMLGAGMLLMAGILTYRQACLYENPETFWTYTLARNPECWPGYNNLGDYLFEKGRKQEGMALFQKALDNNPKDAQACYNIGLALYKEGYAEEAIARYRRALELEPEFAQAHYDLGVALTKKGMVDEALAHYQKAIEVIPYYADAHYNLGVILIKKGQIDEAILHFRKALEFKPDYAEAHNNLGAALAQKGQVDEAISEIQKAAEINPNSSETQFNLARLFEIKGESDEAIDHFRKTIEIMPNHVMAHYSYGTLLFQKGDLDDAIVEFQHAADLKPDFAEANFDLAVSLDQKGDMDGAINHYEKAIAIDPKYVKAHDDLGLEFVQKGRLNEAIVQFQQALEMDPNNAETRNNLGSAFLQIGRTNEAIAQYELALKVNPGFQQAKENLAKAQAQLKKSR